MRAAIRLLGAAGGAALLSLGAALPAYAEHTTRVGELQETGVNPWLMALSMGGIVFLLIVFAAIVLFWERNDRLDEMDAGAADEPGAHPESL
ncbi:MAG TPA: hypothetical protein VMT90_07815 [Dehalococcoidia bacterium]|jgi:hypothetical protein|nr:hypothetical protein [Dehalococcoidia bacterium]